MNWRSISRFKRNLLHITHDIVQDFLFRPRYGSDLGAANRGCPVWHAFFREVNHEISYLSSIHLSDDWLCTGGIFTCLAHYMSWPGVWWQSSHWCPICQMFCHYIYVFQKSEPRSVFWMCANLENFGVLVFGLVVIETADSVRCEMASFFVTARNINGFAIWKILHNAVIDIPAPAIFVSSERS